MNNIVIVYIDDTGHQNPQVLTPLSNSNSEG